MPAADKFSAPATYVHGLNVMPFIEKKDYSVRVVLGEFMRQRSSIDLLSPAFYYHIKLKPDARLDIPTEPTHNAFAYAIKGNTELQGAKTLRENQIALFERGDSEVNLYSKDGAELLVLGGRPLNEPVFSYGPFVMNTEEQIKQCISSYRSGKMGNPAMVN